MTRQVRRWRTLFISDLHLGTRGCRADLILEFLTRNRADHLYLVGDVLDVWALKRRWYWQDSHTDVLRRIINFPKRGTRVTWIPGNHDEVLRTFLGMTISGVEIRDEVVHVTADGRRLLMIHGDQFDVVIRNAPWLARAGDWAYDLSMWLNRHVNKIRRLFGRDYWSLSQWAKLKVKTAVNFIGSFEDVVAREGERRGADGVVCGHIHHVSIRPISRKVTYYNCGDWVESFTAIGENEDGSMEIIYHPR